MKPKTTKAREDETRREETPRRLNTQIGIIRIKPALVLEGPSRADYVGDRRLGDWRCTCNMEMEMADGGGLALNCYSGWHVGAAGAAAQRLMGQGGWKPMEG